MRPAHSRARSRHSLAISARVFEPGDLSNFALELDLETVPKMLRLAHLDLSAEPYYSTDRIAAIVMPLIDLMDAQREEPSAAED